MALSAERSTVRRGDAPILDRLYLGLKDNVKIWQGALVILDPTTGLIEPGTGTAPGKIAVGCAERDYDNTITGHTAGGISGEVRQGNHYWASGTSADAITAANIGAPCYVIDDQTVGLTDNGGTRALAGVIIDYNSGLGVLVETAIDLLPPKIRATDHQAVAAAQVLGEEIVFRGTWNAPGAGAQDVVLYAAGAMPVKCRILDTIVKTSNAGAGSGTATVRSATAGGGSAGSSAISTAAIGTARDALGASVVFVTGGGLVVRLTDGTTVGEVIIFARPEL